MKERFGEIDLDKIAPETKLVLITDKIKIELKEGYDQKLLKNLMKGYC